MDDKSLEQILEDMKEFFGELPSPVHEPIRFKYYLKLFTYYKGINA